MKFIKFILTIFWLMFQINASSESKIKLCLTGKIELTLPSYKDSVMNSVNLALNESKLSKNIIVQ